ncbi:hypothetical protein K4F52_004366 [Lecanicillium sp. MT-2017a]|nr:hypothetical protein K4F52_004366 [Lecanicillium sp. MT-2017a]
MSPLVPTTAFARLPYELRSHIWELAAEPRHITVRTEKIEWPLKKKSRRQNTRYETASTPAPAVMYVCRESRQHAPYQRAFTAGTDPRWTWSKIQRLQIRTDDDYDWLRWNPVT